MGKIDTGFTFSHQVFGEGFYTMELLVRRLSDSEDRIPVMVSERLLDITQDYTGQYIEIHGQFRSYNRHEEKHNRLVLSVFAREVNFVEEQDESLPVNQIFLDGFICKPPVYRKTPLGREIADMLLAVNRPYSKSDYALLGDLRVKLYPSILLNFRYSYSLSSIRTRDFYNLTGAFLRTREQFNSTLTLRLIWMFNDGGLTLSIVNKANNVTEE